MDGIEQQRLESVLPDRVLLEACEQAGVRADDAFLVKDLMRRSPATYPACCGNSCTPCAEDLICAAMIAKRMQAQLEQAQLDSCDAEQEAAE